MLVQRVEQALRQIRRERAQVSVAAVARRAAVSRTFLYQNPRARALITAAAQQHATATVTQPAPDPGEVSWRQRALNAEQELKRTNTEISTQRTQMAGLLGRIRDLEHDLPEDGIQRTLEENQQLRARIRQLGQENRLLAERLAGARDNNRFLDRRIAELEAEIAALLQIPRQGQAVLPPADCHPTAPVSVLITDRKG
jgi:chromosome segregation ATPase